MFAAGGGHARMACRQGTDLWIEMVCKLVPFFMLCFNFAFKFTLILQLIKINLRFKMRLLDL